MTSTLDTGTRGLTVRQFAEKHGISESSVRQNIRAGRIPSYKVAGSRRIPDTAAMPEEGDFFMAEVRRIVDVAPRLTATQRDLLVAVLRGGEPSC